MAHVTQSQPLFVLLVQLWTLHLLLLMGMEQQQSKLWLHFWHLTSVYNAMEWTRNVSSSATMRRLKLCTPPPRLPRERFVRLPNSPPASLFRLLWGPGHGSLDSPCPKHFRALHGASQDTKDNLGALRKERLGADREGLSLKVGTVGSGSHDHRSQ